MVLDLILEREGDGRKLFDPSFIPPAPRGEMNQITMPMFR
jgi:hypothetical protein